MAGWKKLCCGVDFSRESHQAMLEAAELARRLDAELTLVHIHEPRPPPTGSPTEWRGAMDLLEMAAEELRRKLERWKSEAERAAGRPVRGAVFGGAPAPELVRFAAANSADAIVVGTHARTGLARLVLGSVAERVARDAPCAVVVVHPGARA